MYKIYKLTNDKTNLCYYGITKRTLKKRLSQHNEIKNTCVSEKLKEDNATLSIELVEETIDKMREVYYIKNFDCINTQIPFRTQKEYYQDNKDELNNKHNEYIDKDPEKWKTYYKKYYDDRKEEYNRHRREKIKCEFCNKEITRGGYSRHKKKCINTI
tara:strand:+ start:47 stop:520 length:474 start_codon:yes stop_codon:yes gene_type:complete